MNATPGAPAPYRAALALDLRPSWRQAAALLLLHGTAIAGGIAVLSGWPLIVVGAGLAMSCIALVAEALQIGGSTPVRVELRDDGGGRWVDRSGDVHALAGVAPGCNSAALVALLLRDVQRRKRWLVLTPDSTSPQDLHRLRLWLRYPPPRGGR